MIRAARLAQAAGLFVVATFAGADAGGRLAAAPTGPAGPLAPVTHTLIAVLLWRLALPPPSWPNRSGGKPAARLYVGIRPMPPLR